MALPASADFNASTITEAQFKTAMVDLLDYIANLETVAPGVVAYYPASSPPSGWLKANGAAISRTTYSALFAAIGVTFGAGDGPTTFNLPDLRGEFIRGFDDGRGVDDGRVLGSAQADDNKKHRHTTTLRAWAAGSEAVGNIGGSTNWGGNYYTAHSSEVGSEARPRNIALLACIKY